MSLIGFLCGVPHTECIGSPTGDVSKGMRSWGHVIKVHQSRKEARNCYIRFLLKHGYQRTDNASTFLAPDNGPAIVLNKESKFGGELRLGKTKRYMPKNRGSGIVY